MLLLSLLVGPALKKAAKTIKSRDHHNNQKFHPAAIAV
jgi:hypothetical protein